MSRGHASFLDQATTEVWKKPPSLQGVRSVTNTHLLNDRQAHPLIRTLLAINHRDLHLATFDWGCAARLPALPRLQVGRVVLQPAQWTVPNMWGEYCSFVSQFQDWRERWRVPKQIFLKEDGTDRLLFLDLEENLGQQILYESLSQSGERGTQLQEILQTEDQAWVEGPANARYYAEFVLPFVRTSIVSRDRVPRRVCKM